MYSAGLDCVHITRKRKGGHCCRLLDLEDLISGHGESYGDGSFFYQMSIWFASGRPRKPSNSDWPCLSRFSRWVYVDLTSLFAKVGEEKHTIAEIIEIGALSRCNNNPHTLR